MKRKLSFFSAISRATAYRVLGILGVSMLLQLGVFLILSQQNVALPHVLENPLILVVMLLTLLSLCVVLSSAFRDRGGHQDYFFGRLRCSRKVVFWNQAAYNALCVLLFFLVETMTLLGICAISYLREPAIFGRQTLMMLCYESSMLHIFLPLSDWMGWVSNVFLVVGLGICTAIMPYKSRFSGAGIAAYLMSGLALLMLYAQWKDGLEFLEIRVISLIVCLVITGVALWDALSEEVPEND